MQPPSCSVVRVAPARRCGFAGAGPAVVALTASLFLLRGGRPPGLGGAEGRACGSPAVVGAGGGGGGAAPPPALGSVWGGGGWGGPWGPLAMPLFGRGGGAGAAWQSWPRGPAIGQGVAPFSRPPLSRAGFSRRPSPGPLIPRPLSRGAGRPGVAVRVSGQWLAGCGAAGSPPALVVSALPPAGGGEPLSLGRQQSGPSYVVPYRGGGVGRGGQPPPQNLPYPPSGPSPAPPLVWGLGLRRRRVVPAVAPVGEGATQGPGPGVRIRDAEHRSPFQEGRPRRLPVGPRRPDH